eukprot:269901-Prymnesium_polylepis.1
MGCYMKRPERLEGRSQGLGSPGTLMTLARWSPMTRVLESDGTDLRYICEAANREVVAVSLWTRAWVRPLRVSLVATRRLPFDPPMCVWGPREISTCGDRIM